MKNLFTSVVAVVLFAAASLIAKPLSITFTADNNYPGSLGTIRIGTGSGPVYMNVPSEGVFSTQVPDVNNVTINNYIIFQGQPGTATLPNGDRVDVSWSAPNIIVIDPDEAN